MLNGFGDPDEIAALQAKLSREYQVQVAYDDADLSTAEAVSKLVESTQRELGGLDILVNNAGIQFVAPIEDFPIERWNAVTALNLTAVFLAMRAAIPEMKRQRWGRIINIASAHGLVASPLKAAYVAAKHGVVGLTKVAALELANEGVTANAICPGWVLTPLVERQIADRAATEGTSFEAASTGLLEEKQPMLSFTSPESIGALCVFLCTDAAATITGASLPIDGAWTAQ